MFFARFHGRCWLGEERNIKSFFFLSVYREEKTGVRVDYVLSMEYEANMVIHHGSLLSLTFAVMVDVTD